MSKLSHILRDTEGGGLTFYCPGCKERHRIQHGEGAGPRWTWNGDVNKPTFTPSILVTWTEPFNQDNPEALKKDLAAAALRRQAGEQKVNLPSVDKRCHSFVTDGNIQFLADCTHALAGQTVPLGEVSC